jgi:hypothetical protein
MMGGGFQPIVGGPPKAGAAGSIPAGRTNSHKAFSDFTRCAVTLQMS